MVRLLIPILSKKMGGNEIKRELSRNVFFIYDKAIQMEGGEQAD